MGSTRRAARLGVGLSYAEPVPSRSMFGARNFVVLGRIGDRELPHEYAEEPDEALWYDEYRPG